MADPADVLRADRRSLARLAEKVGPARARKLLERAAEDLERRLRKIRSDGTWTATHTRLTLEQVREVLLPLQRALGGEVTTLADQIAKGASRATVAYARAAEGAYAGSVQPLAIREASVLDAATSGARASVLRRIASDPKHPGHRGVLERYGEATIGAFEGVLQTRFLARVPWEEAVDQITAASPFLRGAPRHWAERLVRTECMGAHNAASHAAISELSDQLGDGCKILSCTFDDRTGSDSIAVHGQIRRPKEEFDTWFGPVMHPPDRPNDRAVVVMHRVSWKIPTSLEPRSEAEVAARWRAEKRKGGHPPIPKRSTIPIEDFGKRRAPLLPQKHPEEKLTVSDRPPQETIQAKTFEQKFSEWSTNPRQIEHVKGDLSSAHRALAAAAAGSPERKAAGTLVRERTRELLARFGISSHDARVNRETAASLEIDESLGGAAFNDPKRGIVFGPDRKIPERAAAALSGDATAANARALNFNVHEELHSASPIDVRKVYEGIGIAFEEGVTEIVARHVTRNVLGFGKSREEDVSESYRNYVNALAETTQRLFEPDVDLRLKRMEQDDDDALRGPTYKLHPEGHDAVIAARIAMLGKPSEPAQSSEEAILRFADALFETANVKRADKASYIQDLEKALRKARG